MPLTKLITACAVVLSLIALPTTSAYMITQPKASAFRSNRLQLQLQQLQQNNKIANDGLTLSQLYAASQNQGRPPYISPLRKMDGLIMLNQDTSDSDLGYALQNLWDPYGRSPRPQVNPVRSTQYEDFSRRRNFIDYSPYGQPSAYQYHSYGWSQADSYGNYGPYYRGHKQWGFNPTTPTFFQGLQSLASTVGNYILSSFKGKDTKPQEAVTGTQPLMTTKQTPVSPGSIMIQVNPSNLQGALNDQVASPMNLLSVQNMQQQQLPLVVDPSLLDIPAQSRPYRDPKQWWKKPYTTLPEVQQLTNYLPQRQTYSYQPPAGAGGYTHIWMI